MSKNFTADLAKVTGRERKDAETLLTAVAEALRRHCAELDSVALPSFGTFAPVKHEEQIVTDRSTGHRMLLPPEVELTFRPAAKLRKVAETRNEQ